MSIDFDMGIPFLPEEEEPDGGRLSKEQKRRLIFLGGAMNNLGGYTGPVYPVLLDTLDDGEEEDPNP